MYQKNMKLRHFKHLQEKGMSDSDMMEILKCRVIPKLNISFDVFVFRYGIKSIYADKFWRYSVWEVYLNILVREYKVPVNTVTNMMKNAICEQKDENKKKLEEIMEKYNAIMKTKTWSD